MSIGLKNLLPSSKALVSDGISLFSHLEITSVPPEKGHPLQKHPQDTEKKSGKMGYLCGALQKPNLNTNQNYMATWQVKN